MEESDPSTREIESIIENNEVIDENPSVHSEYQEDGISARSGQVLSTFVNLEDDEVEVVELDQWAPSRVNSLFNEVGEESKKTIGSSVELPVVLITHENIPPAAIKKLKQKCRILFIEKGDPQEVILQKAYGVDAILLCNHNLKLDREMLEFIGKKLIVVGLMSAGFDNVDVRELTRRKIKLGNTRSVMTDSVAEVAIGLAIAVAHRFKEGYLSSTRGKWVTGEPDRLLGKQLSGSVCGIIGYGPIGIAIAKRLVPFNIMKICYSGHGQRIAAKESADEYVEMDIMLSESDFIFICCPLTDETKHMFTYKTFQKMKPTCVLINVGKGGVVKTADLVKALQERLIWGAGLDATDPEPLPSHHPLLHLSNCFVTPHIASASMSTRDAMALLTVDNIIAALEGGVMPAEVCFRPDPKGTNSFYNNREPKRTPAKHIINITSTLSVAHN